MNSYALLLLSATLLTSPSQSNTKTSEPCSDVLAAQLLSAILNRDEDALGQVVNNDLLLDEQGKAYLLGGSDFRFPTQQSLRSAYTVLKGKKILTRVINSESLEGTRTVDIVYLPTSTAGDFTSLSRLVSANLAMPFEGYIACTFVVTNGSARMEDLCLAESDALD